MPWLPCAAWLPYAPSFSRALSLSCAVQVAISAQTDQVRLDGRAQELLLNLDRLDGVHHAQPELLHQALVGVEDARLEDPVRLVDVRVQAEVHPGLVELEAGASRED